MNHLEQEDNTEESGCVVNNGAFLQGKYENGYLSNANGEVINCNSNKFNRTEGTIEFNFMPYFNGTDAGTNYFFDIESGAINNYRVFRTDNVLYFTVIDSGTSVHTSQYDISNWKSGVWQQLGFTYNSSTLTIYNNNSLVNTYTGTIDLSNSLLASNFNISNRNTGLSNVNGVIDDLRLSNFERNNFSYIRNVNLSLNESSVVYILNDRNSLYTGNATIDDLRISNITRNSFSYSSPVNLNNNNTGNLFIGQDYNGSYKANTTFDDLRISNIIRSKDFSFINFNESVVHEFFLSNSSDFSNVIDMRVSINNFTKTSYNENPYLLKLEKFEALEKMQINNASIYGAPLIEAGKFGNGMQLNLTTQYLIYSNTTFNLGKGTIEFWIKPNWNYNEQNNYIFTINDGIFDKYYYVYHDGNNLTFEIDNNVILEKVEAGIDWNARTWHHVAISYNNNSGVRIYIDGKLNKTSSTTWSLPTELNSYYLIGKKGSSSLNGTIDELRISSIDYYSPDELYNNSWTLTSKVNDGTYYWKTRGINLYNRSQDDEEIYSNYSDTYKVIVDSTKPIITLVYPVNGANISNSTADSTNFTFRIEELNNNICTLYGNWSNNWHANATINVVNGTNNFSFTRLGDGKYLWNVYCTDLAGNIGYQTNNFSFTLDTGMPIFAVVNLTSNGTVVNLTNAITAGDVLNIRIDLSDLLSSIDRAWVVIWETIKNGAKLFEGFLTNIGGTIWEINITTNSSFGKYLNYTIYANDTFNNVAEYNGNFSLNHYPEFGVKEYDDRNDFALGTFSNTINNTYSSDNYFHDNVTLKLNGPVYYAEGNFTSNLINFNENVSLKNLTIEYETPAGTYINLSYSVGNNGTLVNTTFVDTNETYINLIGNESQYFRFKVNLYTFDTTKTPTLYNIRLYYNIKNTTLNSYTENSILINLSNYFREEDNDNITYSVVGNNNLSVVITNDLLNITNSRGYLGTENIVVKANDSKIVSKSNNFSISVREIRASLITNVTFEPNVIANVYGFVNETDNSSYYNVSNIKIKLYIDNETITTNYTESDTSKWNLGSEENITITNALSLETENYAWTLYSDDFAGTNFSSDTINHSNVGNLTSSGIIFFGSETSVGESYLIYQFNDSIGFNNASAFAILGALTGSENTSVYYSINTSFNSATTFTKLGSSSTAAETVGGYFDLDGRTSFMIKLNTTGGSGNPSSLTYMNISYQPRRYKTWGNFTSQIINLTGVFDEYGKISWDANESVYGSVRVLTRTGTYDGIDYTWSNWSNNTNNQILNSSNNQYVQYQAILNTSNVSYTPTLNEMTIRYSEKIYTNANSYYNYNFTSSNYTSLGIHVLKINITNNNSVYGENQTTFTVWAPTLLNYSYFQNYATTACSGTNAEFNVTANLTRTDLNENVYSTINISLYNTTSISSKICNSAQNCNLIFCIGPSSGNDLHAGNYTLNINATNNSAYYASKNITILNNYLNAKKGAAQIIANSISIADLGATDLSVYTNITLLNLGQTQLNSTIIKDPSAGLHFDNVYIRSVANITRRCSVIYANGNCTEEYNITIIGNSPAGSRQIIWRADWIDQDGTTSAEVQNNTMYVIIVGISRLNISTGKINITERLSINNLSYIDVNSSGTQKLTNIGVKVNNNTFPGSWVTLYSTDSNWQSGGNYFSSIGTDLNPISSAILRINTTITNFSAGYYTGNITINSTEGPNQTINFSIYVNPESVLSTYSINGSLEHGETKEFSFLINATGNAKLENVNVSFENQTIGLNWIRFNETNLMNITEGSWRNISFNVTVPSYQYTGNYNGTIYINYTNLGVSRILLNITVNKNSTWSYESTINESKSFNKNDIGEISNITINNSGNIDINFSVTYSAYVKNLLGEPFDEDYVTLGRTMNPTQIFVAKNSSSVITLWWKGFSTTLSDEWINVTISNETANPSSYLAYRRMNVTNSAPNITSIIYTVNDVNQNYSEIKYNISIKAVVKDDSQIITASTVYSITLPNNTNMNFTPSIVQQDGPVRNVNFTYSYDLPIGGLYSIRVYAVDNDAVTGVSSISYFNGYNYTNLTSTASSITVTNITQANDKQANFTINVSNIGYSRAYNVKVFGNMSTSWTLGNTLMTGNLTSLNSTLIKVNVTIPAGTKGTYYFTPRVNWTDASGYNQTYIGNAISLIAASNPDFDLIPSQTSITVEHGQSGLMSFLINATGNDNVTTYSVSNTSTSTGLGISFSSTTGSVILGTPVNITITVNVSQSTSSGSRQFTVNTDGAAEYSKTFIVTVSTSANNTFTVRPDNLTINSGSSVSATNTQINITHDGTSNTALNFVFNLTGNLTQIANVLNSSLSLTGGQVKQISLNYTTPAETTTYYGNLTVNETNTNALRYVDIWLNSYLFEIKIINITPNTSISAGNRINATVNVSYAGSLVQNSSSYSVTINNTECSLLDVVNFTDYSIITCSAPSAGSALIHNYTITASYVSPTGSISDSDTAESSITYLDSVSPLITFHNASTIALGNLTIINATVTDNLEVNTVLARIKFPNGTQADYTMSSLGSNNYTFEFNSSLIGIYNVTYVANDTQGNVNSTVIEAFEIYQIENFNGYILDQSGIAISTTFNVYESGTQSLVHNFSTNSSGYYIQSIKKRPYDLYLTFSNFTVKIFGMNFKDQPVDFIDLDTVGPTDVKLDNPLRGFGINAYLPHATNITLVYSDSEIGASEDYLQLFTCLNWTYATRTCESNWWVQVPSTLNKIQNIITVNVSSLTSSNSNATSYFIAESIPASVANMEIPDPTITTTMEHDLIKSATVNIQSTGNTPVKTIVFTCESGTACSNLSISSPDIASIPIGYTHAAIINISAGRGLAPGIYTGILKATSENQNKNIALTITISTNTSWNYQPNLVELTVGGNTNASLGYIYFNNTGNSNVNFTFVTNESFVYALNTSVLLAKQYNGSVDVHYTAPNKIGKHYATLNISGGGRTEQVNATFNVTHVINIITVSPSSSIEAGEQLSISARANYSGTMQTVNMTWSASIAGLSCSNAASSYDNVNSKWDITCLAPNITSIANRTIRVAGYFTNYSVTAYDDYNITYSDVFAPVIVNYTDSALSQGIVIPLNVTITEDSGVQTGIVDIISPSGTVISRSLTLLSGSVYNYSANLTEVGEYTLNFTITDTPGNVLRQGKSFELYNLMNFTGSVLRSNLSGIQTNFTFYKNGTSTILHTLQTESNGTYSGQIRNRTYDLKIDVSGFSITLSNLSLEGKTNDPIDLDEMDLQKVGIASTRDLKGLAVNTTLNGSGSINAVYSTSAIDSSAAVSIYECRYFNYSLLTCDSNFTKLPSQTRLFGSVSTGITGVYSYLVSELVNEVEITVPTPSVSVSTTVTGGGGGGGGGTTTAVLKNIENLIKGVSLGKQDINEVEVDITPLSRSLYPGEESSLKVKIKNKGTASKQVTATADGGVKGLVFVENPVIGLDNSESSQFNIKIFIPFGTAAGNYDGTIVVESNGEKAEVPVNIRVLKSEDKLLDVKVTPVSDTIKPGEDLRIHVDLYNLGKEKRVDVQLALELVDPDTEDVINIVEEAIAVETTISVIKKINIPEKTPLGKYIIRGTAYYSNNDQKFKASSISYIEVVKSIWDYTLFGLKVGNYFGFLLVVALGWGIYFLILYEQKKKKRYSVKVDMNNLPRAGPRAGFVGKIAETDIRAFIDMDKLQTHVLVAGSTGSGKSITAQDIAEEALIKNASVIVFDPTAQWTGFLRKCNEKVMLSRYDFFDMKKKDTKAFKGNIRILTDPDEAIDITKYIVPGEITVFSMHKLDVKDIDKVVANTIQQVFKSNLQESRQLKALIVYDEVHRLLPKFGGSGAGFIQLERGAREFRKWGIGLMLISQVLSDFVGEVKANIGTEIQMRTRYEGDLERINEKYGEDIVKSLVKSTIGTGMVENSEYNRGRPYFITFRPILHSVTRLEDKELNNYSKYNEILDELKYSVEQLEANKVDIFDLKLELNLAESKIRTGQFNIVDIYLESLKPKINDAWKKIGKQPPKREKKKVNVEEIKKSVEAGKGEREKFVKEQGDALNKAKEYVKKALSMNMTEEQIKNEFKKAGWPEDKINNLIKEAKGGNNIQENPAVKKEEKKPL
ncbi:DUF87 domain-containing protein [Candidatus Woesearchaeota archaeon]|nr:DUF87 domain-containing protein [Candidatus Woesearchaeota archaeon]